MYPSAPGHASVDLLGQKTVAACQPALALNEVQEQDARELKQHKAVALAALQAPLPSDAREREIADIRRDMNCLGRLQESANDANLENDNRAKEAIKRIKPG